MRDNVSIEWVINKFLQNSKKPKKRTRNEHTRETKKLKYCYICEKSWEIGFGSVIHSYDHLPTYGLIRKKCKLCENKKGD
tara:strand:- start:2748 stop:2987 length:240 start_codon:yes stop_codon:yes gene_type:complete